MTQNKQLRCVKKNSTQNVNVSFSQDLLPKALERKSHRWARTQINH